MLNFWDAVIRAALPSYEGAEKPETVSEGGLRGKLKKVVLAYSGGLDTSVIVPWLRFVLYDLLALDFSRSFCSSLNDIHRQ